jgi:hypothetical protein
MTSLRLAFGFMQFQTTFARMLLSHAKLVSGSYIDRTAEINIMTAQIDRLEDHVRVTGDILSSEEEQS